MLKQYGQMHFLYGSQCILIQISLLRVPNVPTENTQAHVQNTGLTPSNTRRSAHYNDVIMNTMASEITSLTAVHASVYSGADQRKYQSSVSLAFVRGIRRWPVNSPHKGPVMRKFYYVIMKSEQITIWCTEAYMRHSASMIFFLWTKYEQHEIHFDINKIEWSCQHCPQTCDVTPMVVLFIYNQWFVDTLWDLVCFDLLFFVTRPCIWANVSYNTPQNDIMNHTETQNNAVGITIGCTLDSSFPPTLAI